MIEITITGKPIAKGRGRVGKLPNGRPMVFTPSNTRKWENDARQVARQQMLDRKPIEGPIFIKVGICFQIPTSWPQWKKDLALSGELQHTTKPDSDNVLKAVKDALNGIVWLDDCQVVRTIVEKYYGPIPAVSIWATPSGCYSAQITKKPSSQPLPQAADQPAVSAITPAAQESGPTTDLIEPIAPRNGALF